MPVSPSPARSDVRAPSAAEPDGWRLQARRHAPVLLLLIPFVLVVGSFWPGHMSNDSLNSYFQAREGILTNQHSPLLNSIWGVVWDAFNAGPGWVLALQVATFLVGCYLLLLGILRPLWAALFTCVVAFWPAIFGMLGYVSRDVWFVSGVVLLFGLVAVAGRTSGRARWVALAAALFVAFFANATRQNAAPAIWPACILMSGLVLASWRSRRGRPPAARWRAFAAAVAAGTVLTLALIGLLRLATAPMDVQDYAPQEQLYAYDLAALSEQDRENLFPPSVMADQSMAPIDSRWTIDTVGPFVFPPTASFLVPLPSKQGDDLERAWRDAILDDPLGYLKERGELWLRQVALTRRAVLVYHPVIDQNDFGLAIRSKRLDDAAKEYVETFALTPSLDGTAVHAIWIYLLVCVAAAFVLMRRARPWAQLVVGAAAFGAIAYQSGIYFGAMATQYRWQLLVVVVALLTLPAMAVALRGRSEPL